MADIFLSYARKDRELAVVIKERLERQGYSVFFDVDKLDGGDVFPDVIDREVKTAKVVVGIWTPHALSRPWVKTECLIGKDRGVLVPVSLKSISLMDTPVTFYGLQYVDLSHVLDQPDHPDWAYLDRAIGRMMRNEGEEGPVLPPGQPPGGLTKQPTGKRGWSSIFTDDSLAMPVRLSWFFLGFSILLIQLVLFDATTVLRHIAPGANTRAALVQDCEPGGNAISCLTIGHHYNFELVSERFIPGLRRPGYDPDKAKAYFSAACRVGLDDQDSLFTLAQKQELGDACLLPFLDALEFSERGGGSVRAAFTGVEIACRSCDTFNHDESCGHANSLLQALPYSCGSLDGLEAQLISEGKMTPLDGG